MSTSITISSIRRVLPDSCADITRTRMMKLHGIASPFVVKRQQSLSGCHGLSETCKDSSKIGRAPTRLLDAPHTLGTAILWKIDMATSGLSVSSDVVVANDNILFGSVAMFSRLHLSTLTHLFSIPEVLLAIPALITAASLLCLLSVALHANRVSKVCKILLLGWYGCTYNCLFTARIKRSSDGSSAERLQLFWMACRARRARRSYSQCRSGFFLPCAFRS